MRGNRGLQVRLKICTPLPSPGLYPRRIKLTVRSITARAVSALKSAQDGRVAAAVPGAQ